MREVNEHLLYGHISINAIKFFCRLKGNLRGFFKHATHTLYCEVHAIYLPTSTIQSNGFHVKIFTDLIRRTQKTDEN